LISKPYLTAMAIGCSEYFLEKRLCPSIKHPVVSCCGLALVLVGEIIRKVAMVSPQAVTS
jgi:hypothetical protein